MSNEVDYYAQDPWCKALNQSTACLRERNSQEADICLAYLGILEQTLAEWMDHQSEPSQSVPMQFPPNWRVFCRNVAEDDIEFAVRQGLDDANSNINNDIIVSPQPHLRIAGQRLLTRILTCQSEALAMKGTYMARAQKDWIMGASSYQIAVLKIREALDVTDVAISKWWSRMDELMIQHGVQERKEKELLVRDADIVAVASESITDQRDKLLAAAEKEESRLMRKLRPQWESRDEVKQRLGEDRWKNNPHPKYDYAKQRQSLEEELKKIRIAMGSLEELDPQEVLQKAKTMRDDLTNTKRSRTTRETSRKTNNASRDESWTNERSSDHHASQAHRYNGKRPSPEWIERRVSFLEYPDPTEFGWTFTGSWEAMEFFEKTRGEKLVKLDWYFTTATVKTSLDHPVQGRTQLFMKKCNSREYAKVLTNVRTHTGRRYHRKSRSKHS
mmetsp:Transcript_888/g.1903  ORF Transcript_888/g.1903 Transcript_888/m.1903 type:complete len:444 (+) Transcript_888:221-1552(+)